MNIKWLEKISFEKPNEIIKYYLYVPIIDARIEITGGIEYE